MIAIRFVCGHVMAATGSEQQLVCPCGESAILQVDAPMPRFSGHVRGPHAEYKDLPAQAVTFTETTHG